MLADRLSKRHEKGAGAADQACEGGAIKVNAFSSIDLALPVERQMIAVLRDQNMGE